MRLTFDENIEEKNLDYREDRLNQKKKKKSNPFMGFVKFLGYVFALIAVLVITGLVFEWVDKLHLKSVMDLNEEISKPANASGETLTLTQAQLDEMIAQAVAEKEPVMPDIDTVRAEAAEEGRADVLASLMADLSTGDESMVEVLRPYYPEHIVAVSGGKFHFVPIDRSLKQNTYSEANLTILESGEYQYSIDEQVVSHKGIDVSRFQGNIDWKAVAEDGVEFVIIRVGNRGYGTGKLVEDASFDKNMKGALEAGLHVGVYVYTQAITEEEIREEFQMVMDKIEPYNVNCPIVFDVEKTTGNTVRMNLLSVEERTKLTKLFCELVEEAGHKPIIYHNVEMGALMLNLAELEDYDKWLAYYNDDMYYPYEYMMWQYSAKGRVNGIGTDVDMNICFKPFWEE